MALARLARVFLAVALFAVGQSALLHPLEHVDEQGHFVHLNGMDGGDARGENERHDGPSDPSDKLGDSLSALTACAAGAPPPSGSEQVETYSFPSAFQGAPRVAEAPPFLSQGPPASV